MPSGPVEVVKRGRGRPPLDPSARSVAIQLRVPARDYDVLYGRAQREGVSIPEVVRRDLTDSARARDILCVNRLLRRESGHDE
jgi:hypothetical protein